MHQDAVDSMEEVRNVKQARQQQVASGDGVQMPRPELEEALKCPRCDSNNMKCMASWVTTMVWHRSVVAVQLQLHSMEGNISGQGHNMGITTMLEVQRDQMGWSRLVHIKTGTVC
ncbi:hypothetical protein EJB05_26095, partial [Eragrostis curvula]